MRQRRSDGDEATAKRQRRGDGDGDEAAARRQQRVLELSPKGTYVMYPYPKSLEDRVQSHTHRYT